MGRGVLNAFPASLVMRSFVVGLAVLGVALGTGSAFSQGRGSGLISSDVAHRHGLELSWHTQVQVNRANGRVTHLTQHVTDWMYLEVKLNELTWRYSERDRDANGIMIGRTGAAELADAKMRDLSEHFLKPTLTTHVMADVRLYAVSDRGLLHAIDGETGETLWTQQIGSPELPTTAAGANDTYVAVCNGSTIYMLDRRNGELLWTRNARYTISAGPAVTKEQVTVPTLRGAVESYRVVQDKLYNPHIYRSQGAVYMQPVTTPRSVVWATDTGHMYVADGLTGRARFRLEASDAIVGQPAYLGPRYIYAASVDGYLYCCDELSGNMLWRYSTGGSVNQGPVAVGEAVYVVTNQGELHAVDYKSGLLKDVKTAAELAAIAAATTPPKKKDDAPPRRWPVVGGIRGVLSVSPTRIYCLGRTGNLIILDNNSASVIGSMPLGNPDILVHNNVTDRLILGTSTGILQCLHETKLVHPYVHEVEMEKQRSKRPDVVIDAGEKPADAPMDKPMDADPFGGAKPADDPFGAPKKPEKMPENDPFGEAPKKEDKPAKPPVADPFG
jgi:outer membrane protein assembly factor BamB